MNRTRKHRLTVLAGVVLVVFGLGGQATTASGAEQKRASAPPQTRWIRIEKDLGAMRLDGTLKHSFQLGESRELKQLGLRLEIEHGIEADQDGQARSVWRLSGLRSSLAPVGREHLCWQPPAGAGQQFERKKIGRAFSVTASARWMIREPRPGRFEIRSQDGWVWHYERGTLSGIEHPMLGQLNVSTQGAWITRIEYSDAPAGAPALLQATYSEAGQLQTLQIGEQNGQQLTWNDVNELVAWQGADGREVRCKYEAHLLGEVVVPDQPPREVRWRENPGHGRGDSRWPAPVHLAATGGEEYGYELTRRGFILTRRPGDSAAKVVTVFNPRRRRLEQESDGERLVVKFRRAGDGQGALERIESGDGRILEEYFYAESGRLVAIQREGQPPQQLDYDDLGRLIAVDGENLP